MAVFAPRWLEEGMARRAAALQLRQLSHPEEYHERLSREPAKPSEGAFEGNAGCPHAYPESILPVCELSQDDKVRSLGFLSLSPGEAYMRQISPSSHIFVVLQEDGRWNVLQETFDAKARHEKGDDGNVLRTVWRSVNTKSLATNINTIDMALMEASKYLDYLRRKAE